jgi:hypothetical protein
MAKGYFLSEQDRDDLRSLLEWWREQPLNRPQRQQLESADHPSSSCIYIANSGAGIPALTRGVGTGSGTSWADTPGYADCDIERITITADIPDLYGTHFQQRVYNLGDTAIPADTWIPVGRDKYGSWISLYQEPASSELTTLHMTDATGFGLAVGTSWNDLTNTATCVVSGTYLVWTRFAAFWQVASGTIAGLQVQLVRNGSGLVIRNLHVEGFGASQNVNSTWTWFESVDLTTGDTLKSQVQRIGTFSSNPSASGADAYALKT